MNLGELIDWLEMQDPEMWVKDGFASPHSDRGNYSSLAFSPVTTADIGSMLEYARSADGETFMGYHGGHFTMRRYTPVLIGHYGEEGEPITSHTLRYWLITGGPWPR